VRLGLDTISHQELPRRQRRNFARSSSRPEISLAFLCWIAVLGTSQSLQNSTDCFPACGSIFGIDSKPPFLSTWPPQEICQGEISEVATFPLGPLAFFVHQEHCPKYLGSTAGFQRDPQGAVMPEPFNCLNKIHETMLLSSSSIASSISAQ
jgi:hypothetical protein